MIHVKPQITTGCGSPTPKIAVFAEHRRSFSNTSRPVVVTRPGSIPVSAAARPPVLLGQRRRALVGGRLGATALRTPEPVKEGSVLHRLADRQGIPSLRPSAADS